MNHLKKVAIVQPYIFPYLGYFQLIKSVDTFVLYDDVNFIKKGWIHRNYILNNGSEKLFSVPLRKASQNKLINEIDIAVDEKWKSNFFKTIEHSYRKAPYFKEVFKIIENTFIEKDIKVSDLAYLSISLVCEYLNIGTNLILSSEHFSDNIKYDRADRLIDITKRLDGNVYINPQNGKDLYEKDYFSQKGVKLLFLIPELEPYQQFHPPFIGSLSIIDLMVFNSRNNLLTQLANYKLV